MTSPVVGTPHQALSATAVTWTGSTRPFTGRPARGKHRAGFGDSDLSGRGIAPTGSFTAIRHVLHALPVRARTGRWPYRTAGHRGRAEQVKRSTGVFGPVGDPRRRSSPSLRSEMAARCAHAAWLKAAWVAARPGRRAWCTRRSEPRPPIETAGSDAFLRLEASGADRLDERLEVQLVLVGVAFGELGDGSVESVAFAQVGGDRDRVS